MSTARPAWLRRLRLALRGLLIDQGIERKFGPDLSSESKLDLIWRTTRYRAAGLGLALTANERRLLALRNRHRGQRAFIMGNGPSLNACDLTRLKGEVVFGVNSIFLNEEKMGFKPTYYVVEDRLVAEDRAERINAYHGPTKFFGNYLRYCLNPADPDTLWLNVNIDYTDRPDFHRFSNNAARLLYVGGTVSFICMQLAYYLGCNPVYLVGFDHNYQIPADVEALDSQKIGLRSASADPNHFHPDYFGPGYRWHDPQVERMERSYRVAKTAYETAGRKIVNATVGGQLEVFERVAYDSLFSG